jgi:excisionase family DNA binding protein
MLTLKEAAAELGLHVDTLRWQIHNGKLKAHKIGPLWVVSRRSLDTYRAKHMRHPPEPSEG